MENLLGNTDSLIAFRNSRGLAGRGTLLHLTRNIVVFEVYNPYSIVQMSEVLQDMKIVRGEQTIYSGKAVISNLVATGLMLIVSATPVDAWSDLAGLEPGKGLREEVGSFVKNWDSANHLRDSYQLAVSNLRNFLGDLARWLDQVQVFAHVPANESEALWREYLEEVREPLTPKITDLFFAFEREAAQVATEESNIHRAFCRRELHPLTLCSPFVHRSFTKPLGYAGDYMMVNMMLDAPLEGANLYAKIVNSWCLGQGAPAAHRNRIDMLVAHLVAESKRLKDAGKRLRVMNIGCGPAVEIQRFVRESPLCENCDFTLMDFNEETIAYADARIKAALRESGRHSNVTFVQKSVDDLLKEVAGLRGEQIRELYDYVYCAGLFDYLSDRTCKKLMKHFFNWVTPGGLVVSTNVHASNPVRFFMEHIMEWHLIYRDEARMMHALVDGAGSCGLDLDRIQHFPGSAEGKEPCRTAGTSMDALTSGGD